MDLGILGLGLAGLGCAIGNGLIVSNVLKAAARQPELYGKFMGTMFMGIAFVEAIFFITLGMAFIM